MGRNGSLVEAAYGDRSRGRPQGGRSEGRGNALDAGSTSPIRVENILEHWGKHMSSRGHLLAEMMMIDFDCVLIGI